MVVVVVVVAAAVVVKIVVVVVYYHLPIYLFLFLLGNLNLIKNVKPLRKVTKVIFKMNSHISTDQK